MDSFFTQTECDRCNGELRVRTMSWFNEECICNECSGKEKQLRSDLRNSGDNTNYEGCGYIPELKAA